MRRAIAIAVVCIVAASTAYAQLAITSNPDMTDPLPPNAQSWMLVSLRNMGASPVTINSITKQGSCAPFMTTFTSLSGTTDTLAPNQEAQYVATTDAGSSTGCSFFVDTGGTANTTFMANVMVAMAPMIPVPATIQPLVTNFGTLSTSGFEDQYIYVENYTGMTLSNYTVSIATTSTAFSFQSDGCNGSDSCAPSTAILSGGFHPMVVRCAPKGSGPQMATISVSDTTGMIGSDKMVMCNGGAVTSMITVAPKPSLDIPSTGSPMSAMVNFTGTSDTMGSAAITGANASSFSFTTTGCSANSCSFAPPQALPAQLDVSCSTANVSATLTVYGTNGASDHDSTQLNCVQNGPHIQLSTTTISAPMIAVNQQTAASPTLVITNTGNATLTASASLGGTNPGDWIASGSCAASTCTIFPGYTSMIDMTFAPVAFGDRSAQLVITSNDTPDSPAYVALNGSATGGVLAITSPASLAVPFGTIPKNQLAQQPVTVADQGNATIDVTIAAGSPFSADATGFSLAGGASQTFQAQCQSATPGTFDAYMTVSAANAYSGSPAMLHVTCEVADTDVQVMPTSFAYGEVRVGTPAVTKDVTISNPTSQTVHVTRIALVSAPSELALSGGFTSDHPLAAGDQLTASLTLTPSAEVDLSGATLAIDVDGVTLSFPITGKVVTPHSSIVPPQLDLGTACLGTSVLGLVMLVDDGTATLTVQEPVMDMSFATVLQSPTTYPSQLAPGDQAIVGIRPMTTTTPGMMHGTLTWSDDVPSDYSVGVDLEYVASGTALSPRAIAYGDVEVDTVPPQREIVLQNCDPDPVTMSIASVTATQGAASAWSVSPPVGFTKVLAAHERLTIDVQFAPHARGSYVAALQVSANGNTLTVPLTGNGTSGSLQHTDFYACTCSGAGSPASGLWIVAALALITCRRRRGSS
jgi:hypothetical protein